MKQNNRLVKNFSNYLYWTILTRNLAIANRSQVSCTHNTSRTSVAISWPWNLR